MSSAACSLLALMVLLCGAMETAGFAQQSKAAPTKPDRATKHAQPFRVFNPDTVAKPTAGYSQVAEVYGGKTVYIAGQVALDRSGNLAERRPARGP